MSAMEDHIQKTYNSRIHEGASETITWTLENWKIWHKMLSKESDCILFVNDVKLRFFFRPFTKNIDRSSCNPATIVTYYSLCVQILSYHKHVSLRLKTHYNKHHEYIGGGGKQNGTELYYVSIKKSASNQDGIEVVDEEFFKSGIWHMDYRNGNLMDYDTKSFYGDNEDLKISITATLCFCHEEVSSNSAAAEQIKNEGCPVTREMQRVLEAYSGKPSADVSLKMQDNVTLQSHRLILASGSPVFEAMFTSGLKETQTGIVEIPDVSSKVMKIMIQYIHSGKVDFSSSSSDHQLIEQVIYAASKYQLGGLVEYFDNTLITLCNPINVVGLLKLAKLHNLPNATVELENYTKLNALEIVMEQIKKA